MPEQCDLILRGGRILDPALGLDLVGDVAVADGRIVSVGASAAGLHAREVIDVSGKLLLPGMIDTHGHIFTYVTGRFGLPTDMAGVHSGVTTLVDQGGASSMTFPAFRKFIAEESETRVFSFISAYVVGGLEGHYYPDLYGPEGVDVEATVKAACANRDLVRGIKVHAEIGGMSRWGVRVMEMAADMARRADLPLYIHFGQLWPLPTSGQTIGAEEIVPLVVPLLREGDILAHPFSRHPGGFIDQHGKLHPLIAAALDRGLKVDVGHGSHFSLKVARQMLDAGVMPDTLGADMHGYNTRAVAPPGTPDVHSDEENHPFAGNMRFSLSLAMSELLALGVPLEKVVPMVTGNAAKMIRQDDLGTLKPGSVADISVLDDLRGRFRFADNEGNELFGDRMLQPAFCIRAGKQFLANAPILPLPSVA